MKKRTLTIVLILAAMALSGCKSAETEGAFFHDYFVAPFIMMIKALGTFFNSNYGLAIIAITLIVRFALLPLVLHTTKKQQIMKQKMEIIRPEMEAIQKRLKAAKTKEEQAKLQQEMIQLYQKHNFNPFSMGCLPMLLQIPIWTGLYYAIRLSPEIYSHSFLWFNLGKPDTILAVIAAIAYYIQFQVSLFNIPAEQQAQMKLVGFLSPAMIFVASLTTSSALALYWVISGLFLIIQTYFTKLYYQPKLEAAYGTGKKTDNQAPGGKENRHKKSPQKK